MSEGQLVAACIKWLYAHHCLALRNNSGALPSTYTRKDGTQANYRIRFGRKGWSDIIACSPSGRYIEVECKFGKNYQSAEQLMHQEDVERRGGIYIVAYSTEDLEKRKAEIIS